MKKAILGVFAVCFILVLVFALSTASAEPATVISTRCTLRETASYSGKAVTTLHNHDVVDVIGTYGEFYMVTYESADVESPNDKDYGYVARWYLRVGNQETIVLTKSTKFWAFPGSSLAVAEKVKDTELIVLDHFYYNGQDWLCVQVQENVGGVGFVAPSDGGNYYFNYPETGVNFGNVALYALVNCNTLAVRPQANDNTDPFMYLHNGDYVEVSEWGGYFSTVIVSYNGYEVYGYVHTQYLIPIQ